MCIECMQSKENRGLCAQYVFRVKLLNYLFSSKYYGNLRDEDMSAIYLYQKCEMVID